MNSAKIILDYPIELPPHPRVTELTLRRPKVKDELAAKKDGDDPALVEVRLFALLSGQSPDVIGEIDLEVDYPKLQQAMGNFRKPPERTSSGGTPTISASAASASPGSAST